MNTKKQYKRAMTQLDEATYQIDLPTEKVEVGAKGGANFKPTAKLFRWGEECFLKISHPTTKIITPTIEGSKIKWQDITKEIHFYPVEKEIYTEGGRQVVKNNEGGLEIEIILKKKPSINIISLDIETKDLRFYYQPPLSQEEIDKKAFRPENIIGSYAVYHTTKKDHIVGQTNYKSGKAFHIYRPKVRDANNNWIWGDLTIDEKKKTLTITIAQNWLNTATYPIVVDPTIGWSGDCASSVGWGKDYFLYWHLFASAGSGTVQSFNVKVYQVGTNAKVQAVLYLSSTRGRVDYSAEFTLTPSFDGWTGVLAAQESGSVSAANYIVAVWFGVDSGGLYYDAGVEDSYYVSEAYSQPPPATLGSPTTYGTYKIGAYATYEAVENPYPVDWLKKKVISGYHCFMNAYLKAKVLEYNPLKLPDGTTW